MNKIYLVALLGILVLVSGCAANVTDFTYEDSGITIDGDTLYYRDYTVSTSCDLFDIFLVYEEGYHYYAEPYLSMSGTCASGLYVSSDGEYMELRYAYSVGAYDAVQISAVTWGFTIYESEIVPSEATYATITAEILVLEQQIILTEALVVENAAKLYCASTSCSASEELTYTQLSPYFDIQTANYDFTNNGGIIASKVGDNWQIDLERDGTGEWEFPEGLVPSLEDVSSIIVDVD